MASLLIPDVPAGLELKRDHAIAAIAIRRGCSLQEAASAVAKLMNLADSSIKEALRAGP
jgi:hypothetical protein